MIPDTRGVAGRFLALGVAAVAALALPRSCRAQAPAPPPRAEGFVDPVSWERLALRTVVVRGLLPVRWIDASGFGRLSDLRRALEDAVASAGSDSSSRDAARWSLARFEADHGRAPGRGFIGDWRIDFGIAAQRGDKAPGLAIPSATGYDYTPPTAVRDRSSVLSRVSGFTGFGPVTSGFDLDTRGRVRRMDASVRAGIVDVRLGRMDYHLGPDAEEGIVLGSRTAFDGLAVATATPVALPAFLRGLGDVAASLLVARMHASGDIAHPWFMANRIAFAPTPGLSIGLSRAAIFGGEGNEPVTARRLALMLLGFRDTRGKDSDFENQVASIDVAARIGGPLPLLARVEIGFDDIGTPIDRLPAILAGVETGRTPGADRLAIGIELAAFPGPCCGFSPWYRHGLLAAGWSDDGQLLGHSLGGQGTEAVVTWRLDPGARRRFASGSFFVRNRGADNVLAPDWRGTSAGGSIRFSLPLSNWNRLEAAATLESGRSWHRLTADLFASWIVRPGG